MNSHQLKVFLAVADSASFEKGAKGLQLSQPTVSQHIATLERELSVRLLDRSRGGVTLTVAGKLLLRHARQVMTEMEAAHSAIEGFLGMEGAQLKLGASTIPGTYLLPAALMSLFESYPDIELTLLQGDSRETLDRVSCDEVEIGVLGSRYENRGLVYAPWSRDVISLVAAKGHPWSERGQIALCDLLSEPLIRREPGSGTRKTVETALGEAGVDKGALKARAEVGSTEVLKGLIMAGAGAGFVSRLAIKGELHRGEFCEIAVEGLVVERRFHLVRRKGNTLSPAAEILWNLLPGVQKSPETSDT